MAPMIGKKDCKQKLHFFKCEVANCYLNIDFNIQEASENHGDTNVEDSGDEEENKWN